MLSVKKTTDGAKNAVFEVVVSGSYDIEWSTVVDLSQLAPSPKRVRIDEIYYAVSDKVEVQLAWHHPDGDRQPFLPLGGRGRLAWPDNNGPSAPSAEHSGFIEIRTIGLNEGQLVYLMFDLTKQ